MVVAVSASDWLSTPENYVYLVIGVPMLAAAYRVVTSRNVVHAVLYLVATLAASAALFLLLGAEFVAWTVVLVYIGAVVVLFLFGIMITRAPLGVETELSHPRPVKVASALVSFVLFLVIGGTMVDGFGDDLLPEASDATRTSEVGQSIFERFVIPFEVVSVVLLAALIGAIVLARKDPEPGDTESAQMSEVMR
jgi:NADH-quinone oxidoreductase subunit J